MTPLFKKLNYKGGPEIGVFNAPVSFEVELQQMKDEAKIVTDTKKIKDGGFLMAFAITQKELDTLTQKLVAVLADDGVLWFCYPKGTSKKYKCEFNRDTGWFVLGDLGFEGVRAVSIDEDWSALRFRKAEHIKTMTRSFAMSETGKQKVSTGKK